MKQIKVPRNKKEYKEFIKSFAHLILLEFEKATGTKRKRKG